jgi:hypothetical protein
VTAALEARAFGLSAWRGQNTRDSSRGSDQSRQPGGISNGMRLAQRHPDGNPDGSRLERMEVVVINSANRFAA